VRRAERDSRFEVVAHAHAEAGQAKLGRKLRQESEVHRGFLLERRDAHQAGHIEFELIAAERHERRRLPGQHAGLLRLRSGVDLDEEREPLALALHLLGDGARDLFPVDGVDGVEQLDRLLGLVGLQRADQMQFDLGKFGFQRRPFGLRLLHAVLAEAALAGLQNGNDRRGFERLGDRDQFHVGGIALCPARDNGEPRFDLPEPACGVIRHLQRLAHAQCRLDPFVALRLITPR